MKFYRIWQRPPHDLDLTLEWDWFDFGFSIGLCGDYRPDDWGVRFYFRFLFFYLSASYYHIDWVKL